MTPAPWTASQAAGEAVHPLVTVAVPVYNGAAFLERALAALVAQTYPALEVVVVDNGSTDATSEIAKRWASRHPWVRHVRFEHTIPMVPNFRRALTLAKGVYFTWNSADDWRAPETIATCVAALEANPSAVMAAGPVVVEHVRDGRELTVENRLRLTSPDVSARVSAFTSGLQHASMLYGLYRRDAIERIVFPAHSGQDYLVCLQASVLGQITWDEQPVITYRHVWGEVDTPIYKVERPTLRDLLIYRGVRRRKCWVTLLTGAWYIWRLPGVPAATRREAVRAHVRSFVQRYGRGLAIEIAFMVAEPAAWAARPLVPLGRRLKERLRRATAHAS